MDVSNQSRTVPPEEERGPRARTMRLLVETAVGLMQGGRVPSVSDVAEAAKVSRATAYRYFPSQAALVATVVDEALGPILEWRSSLNGAEERVASLLSTSLPRLDAFEATFRAALMLSLDQWARERAETLGGEAPFTRGHRIDLLRKATAPVADRLGPAAFERLVKALSLVFGIEALIVLKDIGHSDAEETRAILLWAARALVRQAMEDGRQAE